MEENYRLEKIIGTITQSFFSSICCLTNALIGAYMSDLDKELGLGLYLSKHGLSEEQKKAKRRKKLKDASTAE
jgi:hypothetical protein